MASELPVEVVAAGVGAIATYGIGAVARWVRKPSTVDEAAKRRDEAMSRRAEDRFVLKETCEKCDRGFQGAMDNMKGYIDGVNERVGEVASDVRAIRDHLLSTKGNA